jgi:hypothetical protein
MVDIYIIFSCVFVYPVTQSSPRRFFGHGVEHVEKGKKDRESNNKREKAKKFSSCSRVVFYPMFFHLPIMSLTPITPLSFLIKIKLVLDSD